jgi:predicted dehydrogenase
MDYRVGVSASQELGGGALLELSHELDYLRWIFGDVDWIQASLGRQSALEIDVEDTAHLVLGFMPTEDGRQLVGCVSLDLVRHDVTRTCVAIGESGSLRWNGIACTVEHLEAGTDEWREIFRQQEEPDKSYLFEWEHFLACIEDRQLPLVSGEDGLEVLQIVEAARLASKCGKRVSIKNRAEVREISQ